MFPVSFVLGGEAILLIFLKVSVDDIIVSAFILLLVLDVMLLLSVGVNWSADKWN